MAEATGMSVASSEHWQKVVEWLSQGCSVKNIQEKLDAMNVHFSWETLRSFELKFYEPCRAILLAKLEQKIEDRSLQDDVLHARLSKVDSIVDLIRRCEKVVKFLENKAGTDGTGLSLMERGQLGHYYDRIRMYRQQLETARSSEVEKARSDGIELVVDIALKYLPTDEDKTKFIMELTKHTKTEDPVVANA